MTRPARIRTALALALTLGLAPGCASTSAPDADTSEAPASAHTTLTDDFRDLEVGCDLEHVGSMELTHARRFTVDYLEGGRALVCMADGARYLVQDAQTEVPAGLASDIRVIERPIHDVYLAASDTFCAFRDLDAIGSLSVSGIEADGWQIEEARAAMEAGAFVYGGSYRSPDYELLLSRGVTLAVESTMINHVPDVAEKLESLGITCLTELSSYEADPLGRAEWVRLWGLLLGRDEEAEALFSRQQALVDALPERDADLTVAFFYLNASGAAVVRRPGDYVSAMIERAGGTYAFSDLEEARAGSSTTTLDVESFYAVARDVDVIIYNGTIDDTVDDLAALLERCPLLEDAKAVREGRVWATERSMYQEMCDTGTIISDLAQAFEGTDGSLTYLRRLT